MLSWFAYSKKYGAKNIILLYPNAENTILNKTIEFESNNGTLVKVKFIDLFNIKYSINNLISEL